MGVNRTPLGGAAGGRSFAKGPLVSVISLTLEILLKAARKSVEGGASHGV